MLQNSEINSFIEYMQKNRSASQNTLDAYTRTLLQAQNLIDEEQDSGIRRFDITPFRLQIAKLSKKSIAQKVSALRSFFEYLKLLGDKVFVVGDEQVKTPQTLPKPANSNAIDEALEIADLEQKVLILLMFGLGLRFFEASKIELKDISNDWIRVCGKGNKTRELPILPIIKNTINEYIAQNKQSRWLFEQNCQPLSAVTLRYRLMKVVNQTSKRFTPHQLRHAFATALINSGARINDVSEMLGHAELATTKIYTKLAASKKLQDYKKAHPLCKA